VVPANTRCGDVSVAWGPRGCARRRRRRVTFRQRGPMHERAKMDRRREGPDASSAVDVPNQTSPVVHFIFNLK
jgi:hypothetical protein